MEELIVSTYWSDKDDPSKPFFGAAMAEIVFLDSDDDWISPFHPKTKFNIISELYRLEEYISSQNLSPSTEFLLRQEEAFGFLIYNSTTIWRNLRIGSQISEPRG